MITQNKRLIAILLSAELLLLIPLIAMQFSDEVDWRFPDFVIIGMLLGGTALLCELVLRKVKKTGYRLLLLAGVVLGFLLIWAELAVGIFGTPFAGS